MTASAAPGPVDRVIAEPLAQYRTHAGGVACVGPEVPLDVLIASGRPFGHLPWQSEGVTPRADAWLESSFPFWARSILEQWHAGAFDAIETVVFSRADDASQRLYYYVAELQRRGSLGGPSCRMFDIALVPRTSSLLHTEVAVVDLMRALDVSRAMLSAGIERTNRLRGRLAELNDVRAGNGPLYERLGRAALWRDPTSWIDGFAPPARPADRPRVLLAGSMPVDERIHRLVEASGASVIAETHPLAAAERLEPLIRTADEDSIERAVARHLRSTSVSPRASFDRASRLAQRAQGIRAAAVILWLTREDEALAWHVPAQKRALDAAGIPTLVLPAARWQCDDDAADRIVEFCLGCARASA